MIIEFTSQNGTTISFEKGQGRFNLIKEGKDTRIGNIEGFSSITHFYKFLVDNYPDIADDVYVSIQCFKPEQAKKELDWVKNDLAHIDDFDGGYND